MKQLKKSLKKKITKPLILALGLAGTVPAAAQFTLDGEVRPRFEYRHGYKAVADSNMSNAAFVQQRTRLNFGYKTEGYKFKITLQDVRVWGSQPQLISTAAQQNNSGAYLGIHEAWGEALMSDNFSLKFGRQEIALDDHRIFGSVGWAQQARSHDAAILKFKKEKFKADFGVAYNQDKAGLKGTEASQGSYKALQYLWLHNDFGENFGASVLVLNNGKEQLDIDSTIFLNGTPTAATDAEYYKDNYSQTIGTKLTYKKDKLSVGAAFYTQMGLAGDRNNARTDYNGDFDKEVSAMNYGVDVSYKITDKLAATAGYEYMSGNSQTDTSASYNRVNHAFTPFYGTNHKFNGFMDYFYVGNHGGSVGLQDIYFKLKYKADKFWVGADVHMFSAANDVWDGFKYGQDDIAATEVLTTELAAASTQAEFDAATAKYDAFTETKYTDYTMSSSFGTEIDLTFGFNLSKGVAFKGGYSVMMATETLAYLKGTTDYQGQGYTDELSSWGWAMIIIKPNFTEKKDK
ncbi:MAG: hypothetical protein ACPGSO_06955 [Vicingaceae bacterium]